VNLQQLRVASETANFERNELGLIDIWQILVRERRWVIGIFSVCILGALAFVLLVRPEWEATAVIQIGQVGQPTIGQASVLIEPPARTMERMRLKSFEDAVLADLKMPVEDNDPNAGLYRSSLKLKLLPNTDLIEMKVRGHSREEAAKWAEATVNYLRGLHEKLAEPSIERLKSVLAEVKRELQRTHDERTKLMENLPLKDKIGPGNRFLQASSVSGIRRFAISNSVGYILRSN
jgi:uncharacterized protein involved in exopolysaccharide biosynthesis